MTLLKKVKGHKATDGDMTCRGFQYELGKTFEHDGELSMCNSGFHFCIHPSGVWTYYSGNNTRVFEIEAYEVLDERYGCGADVKMVAKKIKFIREIKIGRRNTGDRNTGDGNIGDRHSGFFCKNPVKKVFFDEETDQPHDVHAVLSLAHKLSLDDQFEPTDQDLSIPNATRDKILALHKAHIEARRLKK